MQDFTIRRSSRRTLALEITRDAQVLVRAPLHTSQQTITTFVERNGDWIARHLAKRRQRLAAYPLPTEDEISLLREKAKAVIPERISCYAPLLGVQPTGIRINRAVTRFGSCNAKNSLSFSCLLMQYPPDAIDYVVVHELCHIREHSHSRAFYRLVASILPDYRERQNLLR